MHENDLRAVATTKARYNADKTSITYSVGDKVYLFRRFEAGTYLRPMRPKFVQAVVRDIIDRSNFVVETRDGRRVKANLDNLRPAKTDEHFDEARLWYRENKNVELCRRVVSGQGDDEEEEDDDIRKILTSRSLPRVLLQIMGQRMIGQLIQWRISR